MAIFSETFIDAHFIDARKSHISIYYKNKKGQTVNYYIPCTWEHPDFQDLQKLISLEDIEKKLNQSRKKAREDRIEILTQPLDDIDTIFDFLVENGDNVRYLFPMKVKVLPLDQVKKSKSKLIKNKIQKSKNILELMGIVGKVMSGK